MTTKLGYVIRQAPYGNHLAYEALEAVFAAGIYGQKVSLFFLGDGVLQLLNKQNTANSPYKNLARQISALNLYGIEEIYVSQSALNARDLTDDDLLMGAQVLSDTEFSERLHQQQALVSF